MAARVTPGPSDLDQSSDDVERRISRVEDFLVSHSEVLIMCMAGMPEEDRESCIRCFVHSGIVLNRMIEWLQIAVEREIENVNSTMLLFRTDSIASHMLREFITTLADDWFKLVIQPHIDRIVNTGRLEIDQSKNISSGKVKRNEKRLVKFTIGILIAIRDNIDKLPSIVRMMFSIIVDKCRKKFSTGCQAINSIFFLRFICSKLIGDGHSIGLEYQRSLILVSKLIQSIVNNELPNELGLRHAYTVLIDTNGSLLNDIRRDLCRPTDTEVEYETNCFNRGEVILEMEMLISKRAFYLRRAIKELMTKFDDIATNTKCRTALKSIILIYRDSISQNKDNEKLQSRSHPILSQYAPESASSTPCHNLDMYKVIDSTALLCPWSINVNSWGAEQVTEWLRDNYCDVFVSLFHRRGINGGKLLKMGIDDLPKTYGADRHRLINGIEQLRRITKDPMDDDLYLGHPEEQIIALKEMVTRLSHYAFRGSSM